MVGGGAGGAYHAVCGLLMSGHAYQHTRAYCTLHRAARRLGLPPLWLLSSLTVSHYRTVGRGGGSEEHEPGPALSPAALPSPTPTVLPPPPPQQSVLTGPGIGWYICRRTTRWFHARRQSHNRPVYGCTGVMHRHIDTEYACRHGDVSEVLRGTD